MIEILRTDSDALVFVGLGGSAPRVLSGFSETFFKLSTVVRLVKGATD